MIKGLINILQDVDRFFEKAKLNGYLITNVEVMTENWIRVSYLEETPEGTYDEGPSTLEFSNGNGELTIQHPVTQEDVYEYADEFGWDEETIHYIRYGKKGDNE